MHCFCNSVAVVVNYLDRKQQKLPLVMVFFSLDVCFETLHLKRVDKLSTHRCNWSRYELILNTRAKNSGV